MAGVDWTRGYSCHWRAYEVKRSTWADGAPVEGLRSVTVSRECSGSAPTLESGSVRVDAEPGAEMPERYLRVVLVATQDGVSERVDVATMLCAATGGTVSRGVDEVELTCRSVLMPAATARLDAGTYAPRGCDGVAWAASMLSGAVAAPVEASGGFSVDQHVVFDLGSTVLEAVWSVLRAGGHTLQVEGDGTVRVLPLPTDPALVLDQARARLLSPGVRHRLDWTAVPNRYVAVDGAEVAEAVNDDPGSVTSTVSRGYRHDVMDTSPKRVGGETLAAYCRRRLEEESTLMDERTYVREWWPGVLPGSVVRGSLSSVGIEGDLRVSAQTLTCGRGVTVEETAAREVRSWSRTA